MKTISTAELADALRSATPPVLLHILPEESWEIQRIPGSRCACVYEMSFVDTVIKICPETSIPIVVYGMGRPSLESSVAAAKLTAAGYIDVREFSDGLTAWMLAGLTIEGSCMAPEMPMLDGIWHVDTTESIIRWTGRNLLNYHQGHLKLSRGFFEIQGETLTQSSFTIDMRSIACDDILDQAANQLLLQHLADIDFFSTHPFPEATFIATEVTAIPEANLGAPNYKILGDLTLRGITHPIRFPVVIALGDEGRLTTQAQIEIDRTCWGVNYGSGRLFSWLDKHVVNDLVALHLKMSATRAQ
jgi:polyisoprenoid-binding protein YceI